MMVADVESGATREERAAAKVGDKKGARHCWEQLSITGLFGGCHLEVLRRQATGFQPATH